MNKHRGSWFEEAKLGLFIHWGIYSIPAVGEWTMFKDNIPKEEYNQLAAEFRPPETFSPEQWGSLAKRAGMRYAVLTTRHHDGFALFDSRLSDFNSVKTAAGRDFVREFVEACRKHDLRVGLYYSVMNWQFPASVSGPSADPENWEAMVAHTHGQLRELMSNYGKIDLLWYDGTVTPGVGDPLVHQRLWRTPELNAMARELQPDILINDRAALPEDFSTPEQCVTPPPSPRRWEACVTLNNSWGYKRDDHNFKSVDELKRALVRCASNGGNLLLNVGPRPDGSVQAEAIERLEALGAWLRVNGEAIHGAERCPFSELPHLPGPTTVVGDRAYFHLFDWKGPECLLAGFSAAAPTASLLGSSSPLAIATVDREGSVFKVQGLDAAVYGIPSVLKVELNGGSFSANPPDILGWTEAPESFASDAPVLGAQMERFLPDLAPAIPAALFAKRGAALEASERWTPGWTGWKLLPSVDGKLNLDLDIPCDGRYDLILGVVAKAATVLTASLDASSAIPLELAYAGHPDQAVLADLRLEQGRRTLSLSGDVPFAVYALRVQPLWRPLPSELWQVIGPFPTEHGPQRPLSLVKGALDRRFPPELEFDPKASYVGAAGRTLSWSWTPERLGDHTETGVNFPLRCDLDVTGVCYARTILRSPVERDAVLLLGFEWWGNAYLDGEPLRSGREDAAVDGAQFSTVKPAPVAVRLKQGDNVLLVKCHKGTTMHWFTCRVSDPGDLLINHE